MTETAATRRCEHGKLGDDWCEKCALGEYALYQTFTAFISATEAAWIEDEKIAVMDDAPSRKALDRARGAFSKAADLRSAFIDQLHAMMALQKHWQTLAGENFHASHAAEVAKAGVFRGALEVTELLCKASLGALHPVDEEGLEVVRRIPRGEIVKVTFTRPRNLNFHRKFFALLNLLYHNQPTYDNFEHFRSAFEIALGHCETFKLKSGETAYIAKSISFAKLDQSGFEDLWERSVVLAVTKIIPGLNRADLETEILELVA